MNFKNKYTAFKMSIKIIRIEAYMLCIEFMKHSNGTQLKVCINTSRTKCW